MKTFHVSPAALLARLMLGTFLSTAAISTSAAILNYGDTDNLVSGTLHPWHVGIGGGGVPPGVFMGAVEINGGSTAEVWSLTLGLAPDSTGSLVIDGTNSELNIIGDPDPFAWAGISVGELGAGLVVIQNGAALNVDSGWASFIGGVAGSSGSVTVTGGGSGLNFGGGVLVGAEGGGTLNVFNGGSVDALHVNVGQGEAATGTVNVSGAGSQISLDPQSYMNVSVGDFGQGTINVSEGAILGNPADTGHTSMTLGWAGKGTLNITGAGKVYIVGAGIGQQPESSGVVNVSGIDSALNLVGVDDTPEAIANGGPWAPWVNVGRAGFGALNVSDGGKVLFDPLDYVYQATFPDPSVGFNVGRNDGGIGIVTVRNPGSEIRVKGIAGRAGIGRGKGGTKGTGSLIIMDGGKVIFEDFGDPHVVAVAVAPEPGGVGTIRVEGVGEGDVSSELTAGHRLCVGLAHDCLTEGGIGTVVVADGGVINVDELVIGSQGTLTGSGGTVNVSGSTLKNGGIIKPIGSLTINGRFEQTPGGTLLMHVNGTAPGEFDQLVINGSATLAGKITLVLGEGIDPGDTGTAEFLVGDLTEVLVEVTVMDADPTTPDTTVPVDASDAEGLVVSLTDEGVEVTDLEVPDLTVAEIDIKPGSNENTINWKSPGVTPVAILSAPDFDATSVVPGSVTLAGGSVKVKGKGGARALVKDVNGDGLPDLIVKVVTAELELAPGDTEATLKAQAAGGVLVTGTDQVRIVPAGPSKKNKAGKKKSSKKGMVKEKVAKR